MEVPESNLGIAAPRRELIVVVGIRDGINLLLCDESLATFFERAFRNRILPSAILTKQTTALFNSELTFSDQLSLFHASGTLAIIGSSEEKELRTMFLGRELPGSLYGEELSAVLEHDDAPFDGIHQSHCFHPV